MTPVLTEPSPLRATEMVLCTSVLIARPVEAVYAFAANHAHDVRWREGVRVMRQDTPGTVRLGTRTHEVLTFPGSTYVTDCEVVALEEGREYAFESIAAQSGVRGVRRFTPHGQGTRYTSERALCPPRPCAPCAPCWAGSTSAGSGAT